jgi:hypothetical protein
MHIRIPHSLWNITACVQNPPNINAIITLQVEHQKRVSRQRPGTKTGQAQLMSVAGGAGGGMMAEVLVGLFQGINKAQCSPNCALCQIEIKGSISVPAGLLTRDDGLGRQALAPGAVRA